MDIRQYWKDRRAAKKEQKKQRKLDKKNTSVSGEEKAVKIMGILFAIFVVCFALFNSCSGLLSGDGYDWNSLVGITNEMKTAITEEVDTDDILKDKIVSADLQQLQTKLNDGGIDFFSNGSLDFDKIDEYEGLTSDISFSGKEIGTLVAHIMQSEELDISFELLEFELYYENGAYYERSVVYLDLSVITTIDLPKIYLTTMSKIVKINGELQISSSSAGINNIEDSLNDEIITVINRNSIVNISSICNSIINQVINVIVQMFDGKLSLDTDRLTISPK